MTMFSLSNSISDVIKNQDTDVDTDEEVKQIVNFIKINESVRLYIALAASIDQLKAEVKELVLILTSLTNAPEIDTSNICLFQEKTKIYKK